MKYISPILTLLLLAGVYRCEEKTDYQCHVKVGPYNAVTACSTYGFVGDSYDKCAVLVQQTLTGGTYVAQMCLPKSLNNPSACGKEENTTGGTSKICCCEGPKCIDDAFAKICKGDTTPTSSSTKASFQCLLKTETLSGIMACDNPYSGDNFDKCAVLVNKTSAETTATQSCLPKVIGGLSACGKEINITGSTYKVCCCHGEKCNDASFVQKCRDDTISTPIPTIASFRCNYKLTSSWSTKIDCNRPHSICGKYNNKCDDLCKVQNGTAVCSCGFGGILVDGYRCLRTPNEGLVCNSNTSFMCSDGRRCIHRSLLCNGYDDCDDTSDEAQITCDHDIGKLLDTCAVIIQNNSYSLSIHQTCLPKKYGLSACGQEKVVGSTSLKVCCCHGEECNDDAFEQKCLRGEVTPSASNILLGSATILISSLVLFDYFIVVV